MKIARFINKKSVVEIVNRTFLFFFIFIGIIILFFNISRTLAWVTAFGSFLASLGLEWVLKHRGVNNRYLILINISLLLGLLGELVFYYNGYLYYDKILHFFVGLMITLIVYEYYSKSLKIKKDMIFFTALGMLTIWEIYEYILMSFFGFPLMGVITNSIVVQSPFDDTMMDLIWGSIGAIIALLIKENGSS